MSDHPDSGRQPYGTSPGQSQGPFQGSQQQQQQQQSFYGQQPAQQGMGRSSALNMNSLASALPEVNYGQNYAPQSSQRFQQPTSASAMAYQMQQLSQLGGQSANLQYGQQFPNMYGTSQASQQPSLTGFANHQYYGQQQQSHGQGRGLYQQAGQFQGQAGGFSGAGYPYGTAVQGGFSVRQPGQQRSNEHLGAVGAGGVGRSGSSGSTSGRATAIRGPPRKPKQSGHALWVGNLPPGANVVDLKDHFSRDATDTILSVFLISKSNCAFVNFKTEEACQAAMTRFHDSRFQGVRLVCRLRRNNVSSVPGVPTGPASQSTQSTKPAAPEPSQQQINTATDGTNEISGSAPPDPSTIVKEKYFIVKSLTVEDLEMSVRNGIWATQSHNEKALNNAFKTAETVYLIFSANKSGEYFGYAKMTSAINDDPAAAIEFAPKAQAAEDLDLPKAIPTPATEWAPRGRIIDDSARGTIFWEAEPEDGSESDEQHTANRSGDSDAEADGANPSKAWGKPFQLEWISTNRLPFYRTRGLRNPWNSNREVKIARDGTELETSVGRRLLQMFHREPSPVPPGQMPIIPPSQMAAMMGNAMFPPGPPRPY